MKKTQNTKHDRSARIARKVARGSKYKGWDNPRSTAEVKIIYEGNFLKNAIKKTKTFLKDKVKTIKKNAKAIFKSIQKSFTSPKNKDNFLPGKLIAMNYKAKDATKRFDKNPLVIVLGPPMNPKLNKTHVLGLNLHWLPMRDRVSVASFFVELNKKRNGKIQYKDILPFLQKFKGHPVLRMYIIANIGPKVIEMPSDQFLTAAAIPSEAWAGR